MCEDAPINIANGENIKDASLVIPGMHNLYNTCAAVACVKEMLDIKKYAHDPFGTAVKASMNVKAAFGRMEKQSGGISYDV